MKVIKPSAEVMFFVPENGMTPEQAIEKAGRNCYKSEDKITHDSAEKFVRMLRKRGHHAMLEFGYAMAHVVGDRGNCYDDCTEVLTWDGWKLFKDTSDEDKFITLNPDTYKTEYQTRTAYIEKDWDGYLIHGSSTAVDFAVTPDHRMLWYHYDSRADKNWRIDKAEEMENRRVKFQRGLFHPWEGKEVPENYPQQNTLAFAKFMGMFITDDCKWQGVSETGVRKTVGQISLSQTKERGCQYIKKFLDELGWHYIKDKDGFRINNSELYRFICKDFPEGEKKHLVGRVPSWIKEAPVEYIRAFLESAVVGNGNVHKKNNHEVIYTACFEKAGDYQELYLKAGLCSIIRVDDRVGEFHFINGRRCCHNVPTYIVSVTKRTNEHLFNRKNWKKLYYDGKVYCVTVPNGLLYVRRNGKAFWSGNSHEQVRHRLASYAQESTRYCNYSKGKFGNEITVVEQAIAPIGSDKFPIWKESMERAERDYFNLLKNGWPPEEARSVLPIALKAEIVVGANLREWRHIFNMRCSKFAHPIIRGIMLGILKKFNEKMPSVYEDLAEEFLIE